MNADVWRVARSTATAAGQQLRELRVDAGLSMHDLCMAVGIVPDPPMISRIEHGHHTPTPVVGERLTAWMISQTRLQTAVSDETVPSAPSHQKGPQ